MSAAAMLTLGKAVLWVALPLVLACWELYRLRRDQRRSRGPRR